MGFVCYSCSATNSISMVTWSCSNSGIEVMKPGNNTIKPRPQALSLSLYLPAFNALSCGNNCLLCVFIIIIIINQIKINNKYRPPAGHKAADG